MISRLVFLLFCGNIALNLGNVQKLPRVKRQSLRVQINVTDDTVCMRYIRPSLSTKLEGFILGYGSSFFSNQYISLPSDGKSYITEVDAEPRYLIAVRPAPVPNYKKPCSGKMNKLKPLQLVIGTLTPTSAFLSWGVLVNPKHDWTTMNNCANGRFYTVRYREKDKNKKWVLQLCPTTETVVDNLKPNTVYEFGVKDNTDNGIWSKSFSHKMAVPAQNESQEWPSESKTAEVQEISPQSYPAMTVLDWERSQPTAPSVSEESESSPAPSETPFIPFKWEPSATPEGRHLKPVPSLPPLKQDTPKISRITEQLKSTPAPLETKFVPSTPKPFARPETPELKYEKEPQWESTTTSIYKTPELPRTTLAPSKTKIPVSKPQILPHLEEPKTVPAVTSKLIPVPTTTKVSHTVGHPVTTMASYEPSSVRSKSKESKHGMPEVPDSKPVLEPFTFSNELPTVAPKAKHHVPSHKTTISPHVLHPKPEKKDPEPFRHETQLSPDEPQTKPDIEAVTIGKEKSKTTIAPKVSHQIPARTKTSPSPGIISTKPSTKSGRRVSSKPSPKVPQTKPEIIQFSQDPISTMIPQATETAKPTLGKHIYPQLCFSLNSCRRINSQEQLVSYHCI
uniref:Fibronectin type-III domain-containing protein n=1 Tax=Varanus komodoensis TaxID=61221 RepID=A0A8D2LRB4_VARKO